VARIAPATLAQNNEKYKQNAHVVVFSGLSKTEHGPTPNRHISFHIVSRIPPATLPQPMQNIDKMQLFLSFLDCSKT
jgi:hypothetical protein